jgi:probable HAF family extracellular repeat protein
LKRIQEENDFSNRRTNFMKAKSPELLHFRLCVFVILAASPLAAQTPAVYVIKNLGTLGGNSSDARGINDRGEIVGVSRNAAGQERAFLYVNGAMRDLGTLGGQASIALAINGRGQIVGGAQDVEGTYMATDFSWSGPGFNRGLSPAGSIDTFATCVNTRGIGESAGYAVFRGLDSTTVTRAFQGFLPLTADLMPTLGGTENIAFGTNDKGHIVGSSLIARNAARRAFFYNGVSTVTLPDFGGDAEARDINNTGMIVGWANFPGGGTRAFYHLAVLATSPPIQLPNTLGGNTYAHAVNDAGDIVGTGVRGGINGNVAFFYRVHFGNGNVIDLNDYLAPGSGWKLMFANSINNRGQIVGYGTYNGQGRAFLLEPDRTRPVVDPESSPRTTTQSSIKVRGRAEDDGRVQSIRWRVGRGPWRNAEGTTNWSFEAPLEPGRNLIRVQGIDTAKNRSIVHRIAVRRI